jgi:hypothetical protein
MYCKSRTSNDAEKVGRRFSSFDVGHIAPFTNHDAIGLQFGAEISENQRWWGDSANFAVAVTMRLRSRLITFRHGRGRANFAVVVAVDCVQRGHDAVAVADRCQCKAVFGGTDWASSPMTT